jgi:hypothetical protein
MYQSPTGIYLLSRGLADSYIGAAVEQFNGTAVTSITQMPANNQIRFTLASGGCLMYDSYVNAWSMFTAYAGVGAALANGVYYSLAANGTTTQESGSVYTDNGAYLPLTVTLGNINFAGLQGFQRVYEVYILGTYYSPHTLTVGLTYDFGASGHSVAIPVTALSNPYNYRVFCNTQKCESIQITLTDSYLNTYDQGFDLSGISFKVGAKKGHTKNITAAQSYG